jgi:hypothetical protein
MQIQTEVGQLFRQASGTTPNIPGGTFGEQLISKALPDLYTLTKNGLVYTISAAAINPSAFTGGAAGTPMVGIYNPPNSGVDVVILQVGVGIRTTGTAAAATDLNHWLANQGGTAVTGTQTQATNNLTGIASGSRARCMVNTANTASLASTLVRPSVSVGLTAATAITNVQRLVDDVNGAVIVIPGNYYAYGLSVALTAAAISASIIYAEVPA